jgi:CelD/BcsL family acetyltransferase involved in cellulose biosynthesis
MEIFFRRLGDAFLPRGIFSLTFIETAEHLKLAGSIGFRFEGIFSLYNSAFDRAYQPVSPGMVLVAEDIRIAIEAGCSAFDMLKGDYAYKYRFGAVPRVIKRVVVTRRPRDGRYSTNARSSSSTTIASASSPPTTRSPSSR